MPGPKFAIDIHADAADLLQIPIEFLAPGDNVIVAALAGTIIRVWKIFFVMAAATQITFKDGANATSGTMVFPANGAIVLDFDTKPWITTSIGNPFIINSSSPVQVSGTAYYTREKMT